VVQDAWARGQSVVVHGWVYGLHNGLLKTCAVDGRPDEVVERYRQQPCSRSAQALPARGRHQRH
jgi:carbonic anhydrase